MLAEWRPVDKALHGRVEMALLPAMNDLRAQLARLVHDGFIGEAGPLRCGSTPATCSAMTARVEPARRARPATAS